MTTVNYHNGWDLAQWNLALLVLENRYRPEEVIKIEPPAHEANRQSKRYFIDNS